MGTNSSTAGFLFVVYVAGCLALLAFATSLYKSQVEALPSFVFDEPVNPELEAHYEDSIEDEVELEPLPREYHRKATQLNDEFLADLYDDRSGSRRAGSLATIKSHQAQIASKFQGGNREKLIRWIMENQDMLDLIVDDINPELQHVQNTVNQIYEHLAKTSDDKIEIDALQSVDDDFTQEDIPEIDFRTIGF